MPYSIIMAAANARALPFIESVELVEFIGFNSSNKNLVLYARSEIFGYAEMISK
jgi:hypothetical protein